jgi:hypothetical protein
LYFFRTVNSHISYYSRIQRPFCPCVTFYDWSSKGRTLPSLSGNNRIIINVTVQACNSGGRAMLQTITAFSQQGPGFCPWQFHVRFVEGEVARTYIILRVIRFSSVSTISLMLHTHKCLNITLIRRTRGWIRGSLKKITLFNVQSNFTLLFISRISRTT